MNKIIILYVIIFSLFSCSQKSERSIKEIKVNPYRAIDKMNLSEFVKSIDYIKLETNSDCILGRISKVLIRNKFIYVFDQSQLSVFIFDHNGKFISKFNKWGNGPGEYRSLGPGFISQDEKYIEIYDFRGPDSRMLKYRNLSFEFINESPIPGLSFNSMIRKNGYYYFSVQQQDNVINGNLTNADLIISDTNNNMKIYNDKTIETNSNYYSFFPHSFISNSQNEVFVSFMFDHTFYKLEQDKVIPEIKIDFGDYAIGNDVMHLSTNDQLAYFRNNNDIAYFPVLNISTDMFFCFTYLIKAGNDQHLNHYIIFKENGKTWHVNKIVNDITEFPSEVNLSINHAVDVTFHNCFSYNASFN